VDLLADLISAPRRFAGRGVNHAGEHFTADLELRPLAGKAALMLHYVAIRADGLRVHSEDTLLGRDAADGLCLWPVMEELPNVLPHVLKNLTASAEGGKRAVFAFGRGEDTAAFREEITIELRPSGALVYAHAWGLPGGDFAPRSWCELHPATS
jgi:hypothetical protein